MKPTVSFTLDGANLFFHILTQCNLKCRHCYINPEQHGRRTLELPVINAWLDIFQKQMPDANVVFLGGEPTLHPQLSQAVHHARKLGYRSITVDTNGYLFHDFLHRVSPEALDFISFSLDGTSAQTNDALRGKGSFERCVTGMRAAVDRGFNVSLIYTVSRLNIDEIETIPALLEELKIYRFFIQVIGLRGQSAEAQAADWQVSCEKWRAVIPGLARRVAKLGITVTYPKVYLDREDRFTCSGRNGGNYFVFPNGRVYQCPLCEDFPLHSYTIGNQGLIPTPPLNETDLFQLEIPEGCVMNRLIQPQTIHYLNSGRPEHRIACCLIKEEIPGTQDR